MDKELFKKTEGRIYKYYTCKKKRHLLELEISNLERKLKEVEQDIRRANVSIDYYQNGNGITERVQSSPSGSSYAETEMCKEIGKLEIEHLNINKRILRLKAKIRELDNFIRHMDNGITNLIEEDKVFLELKYADKKSLLYISIKMNMSKTTAYRKREELVQKIAKEI